jgi:hypothetical protein
MCSPTNLYDKSLYKTYEHIKIFTGTTKRKESMLLYNIAYYKNIINHMTCTNTIFTKLVPSTLTAKGSFSNISFVENDIIDMLSFNIEECYNTNYILRCYCNYGELTNEKSKFINSVKPIVKERISNRGRKPKKKIKSQRKVQGSGKYFSSQITFEIYSGVNQKIYKIKLFRNGGFQIPGVNLPDMTDLLFPIKILEEYLKLEFLDDDIKALYITSVMRNYICRLCNDNLFIKLNKLEEILNIEKEKPIDRALYDNIKLVYTEDWCSHIFDYIGPVNLIGIAEIQNNCERYFGIIVKFYRPTPWNLNKRTTIKILRSGKINFDGGNSELEIIELYNWLIYIFVKYYEYIIFDTEADLNNTDTSSDTGESIYDDDI